MSMLDTQIETSEMQMEIVERKLVNLLTRQSDELVRKEFSQQTKNEIESTEKDLDFIDRKVRELKDLRKQVMRKKW